MLGAIVYMVFYGVVESGMFVPDPDLDFFTHPGSRIQGSKMHQILDPDW
jgi:hypothetical protein